MAVTLNSTGITFSDGTALATKGAQLGTLQYSPYVATTQAGLQTTTDTFVVGTPYGIYPGISNITAIIVGSTYYASSYYAVGSGDTRTPPNYSNIQYRTVYRAIT
jgi:hypothetical protein